MYIYIYIYITRNQRRACGKADLCFLFVGFLLFNLLSQNVARISPDVHDKFARMPNWSTLKQRTTTTRPSRGRAVAFH